MVSHAGEKVVVYFWIDVRNGLAVMFGCDGANPASLRNVW